MNMHVTAEPGKTVHWLHSTYKTLLTPRESAGVLGIFESVSAPDSGPPRHIHHKEDETFYVLQGEVVFWLEGKTFTKGPGDVVFVPRGKEHTFHVVGREAARLLTILTPGGFEGFFPAVAARNLRIPEDMAEVVQVGAGYNLEFTGPPLKAG
jgi:Mannose-6-phosphate isomerase